MKHIVISVIISLAALASACDGESENSLNIDVDDNNADENNGDAGNNGDNENNGDDENNGGGQACGDVSSGETVEEGELGECGDFESPCDSKGSAPRVDRVCRDGEVVEVEQSISCERDTDGLVVDEGEFSQCEGFEDGCDESGTHARTRTVCQDGQAVEEVEESGCERDTDGVTLELGEFSQCQDFEGACGEVGTQVRINTACADGAPAEVEESQACTRDADGIIVQEGEFNDCGGFEDACDETGRHTRSNVVCEDGLEVVSEETGACVRDTDGLVIEEGEDGPCEGFDDVCDETGTRLREVVVCQGGRPSPDITSQQCSRDTDGTVVEAGDFGECGGFEGRCDETGTQRSIANVCRGGEVFEEEESRQCQRVTEGQTLETGSFDQCSGFDDDCDETGTQSRTNITCSQGQEVEDTEARDCSRVTDGLVLGEGDFGECGDFADTCDEIGTRTRTLLVCREGASEEEQERVECSRDTDGIVADEGTFGQCEGFISDCDETGSQTRRNQVCRDGQALSEEETQGCTRPREGVVIDEQTFVECGSFESQCDETGVQGTIITTCVQGAPVQSNDTTPCTRETDDLVLDEGSFRACGGFEGPCGESGTQTRTQTVCENGQSVDREDSQDCVRQTEGEVTQEGDRTPCSGFVGACGEDGVQQGTDTVCRNGEEVEETRDLDCRRDTDGFVVDEGQPGACGGFSDDCDNTGTSTRTNVVCQNGAETQQEASSQCSRDTEGNVINVGGFGECAGFEDACDESGSQQSVTTLCANGQTVEETQSRDCQRSTDGVRVNEGGFGACVNEESPCASEGTHSQTFDVCSDEEVVQESETLSCDRDPEGQTVAFGNFGACTGFDDDCDETGTESRSNTVCRGGQEVSESEARQCTRVPDNCQAGCPDDDGFEPNQTRDSAGGLSDGETSNLLLCREDFFNSLETDFYRFSLPDNAEAEIVVNFDHNGQDLSADFLLITILDPGGNLNNFFQPDPNNPNLYVLTSTIDLGPNDGGTWFMEVNGTQEGQNLVYSTELVITPDEVGNCDDVAEDFFEVNNSCENATALPHDFGGCEPGTQGCQCSNSTCEEPYSCVGGSCRMAYICGPEEDEDFYVVNVAAGSTLAVTMDLFHFSGNLDIMVFEPDFQTLADFSLDTDDREEVVIENTLAGQYCIRVFGNSSNTVNSYDLDVEVE